MQCALSINHDSITFLFNIAHVIKRSYTSPVILMTNQDYASSIFNFLVDMRAALLEYDLARIVENITNFHLEWLQAVNEIQELKVKVKSMPRDVVFKAIIFTMECGDLRLKQFQRFIDQSVLVMTTSELEDLKKDIGSIKDLGQSLNAVLHEKHNTLQSFAYDQDFYNHVEYELEELLNWLDSLHDSLAIEISKIMGMEYPELLSDLTKTLQQIVNEISMSTGTSPKSSKAIKQQRNIDVDARLPMDETEIGEIMNKISILNKRLERLKNEDSIAVMALQHKKLYMEERLRSLENVKKAISTLKSKPEFSDADNQNEKRKSESRIFDHNLPEDDRVHLVEELIKLWNNALGVEEPETHSIISILSVSCMKEIFQDDTGKFTVDKYGRKIYKKNNDDAHLYQLNEKNELVPINDDEKHTYFYDDCGRYFKNDYNQRIYKAHANASEYLINREGLMVKVKETREGHVFYYDHLGRYYENDDKKKIYWEEGSDEKFENDGMGNLIRIHDEEIHYHACAPMGGVIEESKYVHEVVGPALKECLAAVVAVLPPDPILYLASCLEKYRSNIIERQKREQEEQAMVAERERIMCSGNAVKLSNSVSSKEEEYYSSDDDDYNFVNYKTLKLVEK